MKYLLRILNRKIQESRFYTEIKQLGMLAAVAILVFSLYNYSDKIFSPTGIIWISFSLLAVVLALAIKIYYRMLVIKYDERDTRIKLFGEPAKPEAGR